MMATTITTAVIINENDNVFMWRTIKMWQARPDTCKGGPDHNTACSPPIRKAISLTLASMRTSRKQHVSELITGDRSSSIISSVGVPCDATIWMKADNELRLPQNCCSIAREVAYTHTCRRCLCVTAVTMTAGQGLCCGTRQRDPTQPRYHPCVRHHGNSAGDYHNNLFPGHVYCNQCSAAVNQTDGRYRGWLTDTREDVGSATAATDARPVASHCANSHLHRIADVYQSGHLPVTSKDEAVLITFTPVIESKQHWRPSWCTAHIALIVIRPLRITPEYPWSMLITSESQGLLLISNFSRSNYECWTESTTSI